METLEKIQEAVTALYKDLHVANHAINHLQRELTLHLTEVCLGAPDNGKADELRFWLNQHKQTVAETPLIITELFAREAVLLEQQLSETQQGSKSRNDQQFIDLMHKIITRGQATPAELEKLRHYANSSNHRDRKYLIDELEDALADHNRRTKNALASHQKPPEFIFKFKEDGGN